MMRYGADYLGGKHYLKQILETHPRGWAGGIFLTTFGDAKEAVKRLLRSGLFSDLVVHIAPFDPKHKYPVKELTSMLLKNARWLDERAQETEAAVLLSPFCEHPHGPEKMAPLFDKLRAVAPHCIMLNSTLKGIRTFGAITEIHLTNSKPVKKPGGVYTISFDGFGGAGDGDFTDADIPTILERYPDARHIRLWNFRYNGKYGHLDKTPVSQRKHWPSKEDLRGHNAMMKNREGQVTWPPSSLYKPFADDHGNAGNTKDRKAMCVLPIKKDHVTVRNINGKLIGTMSRYPGDHMGQPPGARYYSPSYAYQIADVAEASSGSRQIVIEWLPPTDGDLRSNRFK